MINRIIWRVYGFIERVYQWLFKRRSRKLEELVSQASKRCILSPELKKRFSGYRCGPDTHKFKGGRAKNRAAQNQRVWVHAEIRKRFDSSLFVVGPRKVKRKNLTPSQAKFVQDRFEKVV